MAPSTGLQMFSFAVFSVATAIEDGCTTMILGRRATADGSTMVTHTADCYNCDFRLARVTRQETPHRVRKYRATYPSEVSERAVEWSTSRLEFATLNVDVMQAPFEDASLAETQRETWTSDEWARDRLAGEIPAEELAAWAKVDDARAASLDSFEALYGIVNTRGVAIGESTCEATLMGRPVRECPTCEGPLVDIAALTKIGLRYCSTARCAIRVMGAVAVKYGFYAAEPLRVEAGEALAVADGKEAWMWHVLPDDTGLSAVWVAQRVPDDSVAVCANAFVVRGVPRRDADTVKCLNEEEGEDVYCEYLSSENLETVAESQYRIFGFPVFRDSQDRLDFAKTFGPRPDNTLFPYSIHRVWRVMSTVAPNATKNNVMTRELDYLGSEFPFAVAVEEPISSEHILALHRDHFEGTNFDLTQGLAAGPWGDPTRYDPGVRGRDNVVPEISHLMPTESEYKLGRFERAISMFRTSYSFVAQSWARDDTSSSSASPPPLLWFSQGAPHAGIYVPLRLVAADDSDDTVVVGGAPAPFATGCLYEQNDGSLWWATTMIANWMRANNFRLAREDVKAAQTAFEARARDLALLQQNDTLVVWASSPSSLNDRLAAEALDTWRRLFRKLVTKYRDGYQLFVEGGHDRRRVDPDVKRHFYPNAWLQQVGYYDPDDPHDYYTNTTEEETPSPPKTEPVALLLRGGTDTATAWSVLGGGPARVALAATLVFGIVLGAAGMAYTRL